MSLNPWTRQQVGLLIEEYKQHPILYSIKNKYYHNRKLRSIAVNEIVKKIRTLRPETQETEVLKKFNGLRTNYVTERKKQLNSIKDITSDNEIYEPSLWYFDRLHFLNDNIILRERDDTTKPQTKSQIDDSSIDDPLHQDTSSGYCSFSTPDPLSEPEVETESKFSYDFRDDVEPPTKKKKEVEIVTIQRDFSNDPDDNGWLHYLSTLLGQISDPKHKVLLRHKITKLLYEEIEKKL